jgi:hypothetical protein
VVATEADNGRTVVVAVGQRLVVELHSTYWSLDRPAPASVLWPDGPVGVRASPPGVGCVPGGGCGTVSQAFLAVGPGTATIIAGRTSCGEAMGCTGDQGRYALTVIVKPR